MKYSDDVDFRQAVEAAVESQSQGDEARAADLRRDIALERCMSRFDAKAVAVKGGFGVRTLVEQSLMTKDVDLLIDQGDLEGLEKQKAHQQCLEYVYDAITTAGHDRFEFKPSGHAVITDLKPDQQLGRIFVLAKAGGLPFTSIEIDFGVKPHEMPVEQHSGHDVLSFAEVDNPAITTASREYIIGDKISLFLKTGMERPRDIVHGALLLEEGTYSLELLSIWLEKLAAVRGVVDKLGTELDPMNAWINQVNYICKKSALKITGQECFDRVTGVLERLFGTEKPAAE